MMTKDDMFEAAIKAYSEAHPEEAPMRVLIVGNRAGLSTLRDRLRTMDNVQVDFMDGTQGTSRLRGEDFQLIAVDEASSVNWPEMSKAKSTDEVKDMFANYKADLNRRNDWFNEMYMQEPLPEPERVWDRKAHLRELKLQREHDRAKASRQRYPNKFHGRHL